MKALAWHGKEDVRCDNVPDPKSEHPRKHLQFVDRTFALYGGFMPGMIG